MYLFLFLNNVHFFLKKAYPYRENHTFFNFYICIDFQEDLNNK